MIRAAVRPDLAVVATRTCDDPRPLLRLERARGAEKVERRASKRQPISASVNLRPRAVLDTFHAEFAILRATGAAICGVIFGWLNFAAATGAPNVASASGRLSPPPPPSPLHETRGRSSRRVRSILFYFNRPPWSSLSSASTSPRSQRPHGSRRVYYRKGRSGSKQLSSAIRRARCCASR